MKPSDEETLERIAEAIRRQSALPSRPGRLRFIAARAAARRAEVLEERRQLRLALGLGISAIAASMLTIPRGVALLISLGSRLSVPLPSILVMAAVTGCLACAAFVFGFLPLWRRFHAVPGAKENR
jgi:hypothetical protein